jgi:hypothetical protein
MRIRTRLSLAGGLAAALAGSLAYIASTGTPTPVVNAGADGPATTAVQLSLNATCSGAVAACTWSKQSGTGTATLTSSTCGCNSSSCDVGATFSTSGSKVMRLSCVVGAGTPVTDDVTFTVSDAPSTPSSGWTDFTASPNSTVDETIYVSSLNGSDSDSGLTAPLAKATLSAAYALADDGDPDWILIERGSTLSLPSGFSWTKNGPASPTSGWMRLGAYGTGARPILDCGSSTVCVIAGPGGSSATPFTSFAITDVHFTESTRIASGAAATASAQAFELVAPSYAGSGYAFRDILFEGNKITGFSTGFVSASDTERLTLRRNIITNLFRSTALEDVNGVLNSGSATVVRENVFYLINDPYSGIVPAGWTQRSHSAYLGAEGDSTLVGNVVIRAPEGIMQRNALLSDRNVFALNHFATNTGVAFGVVPHAGGLDPDVTDNLCIDNDADWIFGNYATTGTRTIARNMVFRDANTDPDDAVAYEDDLVLWGAYDGSGGTNLGVHGTTVIDNWVSGTIECQHNLPSPICGAVGESATNYSNNTFTTNHASEGNVSSALIGSWLTAESITHAGTDYWDDYATYLIAMEHATWDTDSDACDLINYYRAAETSLSSLTCTSDSAPTVNAGSDDTATVAVAKALNATCSDDVSATCTWSKTSGSGSCSWSGGATCTCDSSSCDKNVTCDTATTAVLQLSCNDGVNSAVTDSLSLTVSAASYVLDSLSSAVPACAWNFNKQMKSTNTVAFRVRKLTSNTETDISFTSGSVLAADVTAACQTSSAYEDCGITSAYDLTGNGNTMVQTTESKMPLIATAAGGLQTAGVAGLLVPSWDGTDDKLANGDTCGLTGNVEVGISFLGSVNTDAGSSESLVFLAGTCAGGQGFGIYHDADHSPYEWRLTQIDTRENFTSAVLPDVYQTLFATRDVGQQMQATTLYQDGTAMAHADGTDTQVLSMGATETSWGDFVECFGGLFASHMRSGGAIMWSTYPRTTDKTAVDAWFATQD